MFPPAVIKQAGVSLVIDFADGTPNVLHWGREIASSIEQLRRAQVEPTAHAELDAHQFHGVWRENSRGNTSRPALLGHRSGKDFSQKFSLVSVETSDVKISTISHDIQAGLEVAISFEFVGGGVLEVKQSVKNLAGEAFNLEGLEVVMPLPDRAKQSMDFTGRWIKERQPQRREIQSGYWVREVREGRTSHDYTIVQLAMTEASDYQVGEVWSLGLGFSGNSRHAVEQAQSGRKFISAGELLLPGEIVIEPGETHFAPSVYAIYSLDGIDGITDRSYTWLRSRPTHPKIPRPMTLNVWEAVYFNHNLEKLSELADVAKKIGVERFVLDDGWFGSRRNDRAGLGDWQVSAAVWPEGLGKLIKKVKDNGMQFGLWFEGEMVNPDSDLYRQHPDWILRAHDRIPLEGRHQLVLDLTNPAAYEYVLGAIDKILSENEIDYIKWDHNRFLLEPASMGRPAVHKQTLAIYRLFGELKKRHPRLEIESCASGGGRIDLGMAQVVDRFWTSDCNDALERQYIQRYTQIAIPPEMLGSHIGPTQSHTTGRVHSLSFRAITALFGHAGLEWDITQATIEEQNQLKTFIDYYKQKRSLIHSGRMVRAEIDSSTFVHGVISKDISEALFAYVTLSAAMGSRPSAILLPGLSADKSYRVRAVFPAGEPTYLQRTQVEWLEGIELTGAALASVGLRPPVLFPENAMLIEVKES